MEASQRIVGVQPDQGGEGRHRRNIAGFELGEGFGVLGRRRTFERRRRQRLEGAKRFAATTQHQIADRPPSKFLELSATAALTQMRVPRNLLVASGARGGIDGIAIGGVIEEPAAPEIAYQCRTGVNADTGCTKIDTLGLPVLAKCLGERIEIVRASDRARRIIRLIPGSIEENLDRVADDLRHGTFVREHHIGHSAHILTE